MKEKKKEKRKKERKKERKKISKSTFFPFLTQLENSIVLQDLF